MSELGFGDRILIWRLAGGAAVRRGQAWVLGSRLLRWRYGAAVAGEISLVPRELRAADASFAVELGLGQMGLAGHVVRFWSESPFDVEAPEAVWSRALHGFAWLRNLRAADTPEADDVARALVGQWLARSRRLPRVATEPAVAARRIISWIANADLVLANADGATFDRTTQSLADQIIALAAARRAAPPGYARILTAIALVYGSLCVSGHQQRLAKAEGWLADELDSQIMSDGGHVSRNPAVLVETMLDLLPLRQCFATAGRPFPAPVENAMARMMKMLHFMRLGDGSLARFNGVGASPAAELAAVLAYDRGDGSRMQAAPQSGYARMEQGSCVLIADVGPTPPLVHAGRAMAGCLSFELSMGACPVFVNGGMPGPMEDRLLAVARSTAAHNTLALGDNSSSARRLPDRRLVELAGGEPLVFTGTITARRSQDGDAEVLEASHSAYVGEHGLLYSRTLRLCREGGRVEGIERMGGPRRTLRLKNDVPYAAHFHLAPQVACGQSGETGVVLRLRDGTRWLFEASGAALSIEPSTHYAAPSGMVGAQQIVLRGACFGESEIRWSLEPAA